MIKHERAQQLVVEVPLYTRNIHTVSEGETLVDKETALVQLLTQQEEGRWVESGPCVCLATRAFVFLLLMKSRPIWDRPLLQSPQCICLTGGKSVSVFAAGMSVEPLPGICGRNSERLGVPDPHAAIGALLLGRAGIA